MTNKRLYEDLRAKADPSQKTALPRLALHHRAPRNTFLSSRALHTAFAAPSLVKNTKDIVARGLPATSYLPGQATTSWLTATPG